MRRPLTRKRRHAAVASTLLLAGLPAVAGTIESDVDKLMPLSLTELISMPVITASRQSETRDQTPAHMVVVTREQIRERRYRNLADLLEDMPGIDFQRGTKSSQFNQFAVQGYVGPNKLVILRDGIRIGHPAGGNVPVADNLSLHIAKQVEFVYGPGAALYGADAVAGVVNIISESGTRDRGASVSVGAGNFGGRESTFSAALAGDGPVSLRVGGHLQAADRAPLQDYFPREFAPVAPRTEPYIGDTSSRSVFARLDVADRFTLGWDHNHFRSLTSTGDPPATARYLENSTWTTRSDSAWGKYRFDLGPRAQAELTVDYARMEVDPRSKYNNVFSAFTDGFSYVLGERLGIEQNLNWTLDTTHRVQAGLGYQRIYAIEAASLPAPYDTSRGVREQGFVYPGTDIPIQIYDSEFSNLSAYTQLSSRWNPGLSTVAGVRVDHHTQFGTSVNPRLGAVWQPAPEHLLRLLYGRAFRAASPEESLGSFGVLTVANGRVSGTGFRIPNFELQPEVARTLSLTWDWRPRPDLNLVASAHRSTIDHLVFNRTIVGIDTTTIPGATLINPETKDNAGRQRHHGLDLIAQWRFRVGPSWSGEFWGSASWLAGRVDEGHGVEWDIPLVARRKAKLSATVRYLDRFSVSPQLLWTDEVSNGRRARSAVLPWQCDPAPPAPHRCTTPGATVVNLHLGWHKLIDGHASVWLDIHNLLDRRYYAAHGSGSRTFYDMPQQPRTWMVSFEYRFPP